MQPTPVLLACQCFASFPEQVIAVALPGGRSVHSLALYQSELSFGAAPRSPQSTQFHITSNDAGVGGGHCLAELMDDAVFVQSFAASVGRTIKKISTARCRWHRSRCRGLQPGLSSTREIRVVVRTKMNNSGVRSFPHSAMTLLAYDRHAIVREQTLLTDPRLERSHRNLYSIARP